MKLEKVKFTNMKNFEESYHDVSIFINTRYKSITAEAKIEGVEYEGTIKAKFGCEISPSYYPKKFDKFFSCDHKIVEYDIFLWDLDYNQPDLEMAIYADLGQEDPAYPDPMKIRFIENEDELKKYIADLIYEEEHPWWDREED